MSRTLFLILTGAIVAAQSDGDESAVRARINAVLDDWHAAAGAADEERYFGHLTSDAVFLGTDATERWTRDEFRTWAKPHFAKGTGWKFKSVRRAVTISHDGNVAWFDEDLATEKLGPCRGSGVLVAVDGQWKIAQYVLSLPVPNEVFPDVKRIIETALQAKEQRQSEKGPAHALDPRTRERIVRQRRDHRHDKARFVLDRSRRSDRIVRHEIELLRTARFLETQ